MKKILAFTLVFVMVLQLKVLQTNVLASAEVYIQPNIEYTGNLQDFNDVDYYKINIAQPSSLKIQFIHAEETGSVEWDITLYSIDNQKITQFSSYADDIIYLYSKKVRLPVGTYYIKVAKGYISSDIDYKLKAIIVDESSGYYEREVNNMKSNGQLLAINTEYTGNLQDFNDVDYYKINIAQPSSLKIQFIHAEETGSVGWDITLYSIDNQKITQFRSYADDITNLYSKEVRLTHGTYYIKVVQGYVSSDIDYKLKVLMGNQVKSVKLNKSSLTLYNGKTFKLDASINPSNAYNKKVAWKSTNPKIALVSSNGIVKGISKGTAYITVSTVDGYKTAKCKVLVK